MVAPAGCIGVLANEVIAVAFLGEPLRRRDLIGLLLVTAGIAVVIFVGRSGATNEVLALSGTTSSVISFGPVIKSAFTVCSVTRYTGGVKGRILNGGGKNWLHGHRNGNAGVAHYEIWMTKVHRARARVRVTRASWGGASRSVCGRAFGPGCVRILRG